MIALKTDGSMLAGVVRHAKHALSFRPKNLNKGDWILVYIKKSSLKPGEKHIQYAMLFEELREDDDNTTQLIWGRHWPFILDCKKIRRLDDPFNPIDMFEEGAVIDRGQWGSYVRPNDERTVHEQNLLAGEELLFEPVPRGGTIEDQFTNEMISIYEATKDEIDYTANRFKQKIDRVGGVQTAKNLLKPQSKISDGFERLLSHGRLDLSVEAVVLNEKWSNLFTDEELSTAQNRLKIYDFPAITPENDIDPNELPGSETFHEGGSKKIIINRYERDPSARQACIDHYGADCFVCGFNFGQQYGDDFRGYIHVHHLDPLSLKRNKHVVDPVRDMRPVCPNCHSIIHRQTPMPYKIEQVKEMLLINGQSTD